MCKMSNAMALKLLLGDSRLCIEFELLLRDSWFCIVFVLLLRDRWFCIVSNAVPL